MLKHGMYMPVNTNNREHLKKANVFVRSRHGKGRGKVQVLPTGGLVFQSPDSWGWISERMAYTYLSMPEGCQTFGVLIEEYTLLANKNMYIVGGDRTPSGLHKLLLLL